MHQQQAMTSTNPITITVNGESRAVSSITVAELLKELQLENRKIAVELNREIVRRETYSETKLNAGDAVEIVNFVGGG